MSEEHPNVRPSSPLVCSVLSHPKGAYKWQKKYGPAIIEYIPALYLEGQDNCEVATAIGICESTFYDWIKQYPAFADAVKYGKSLSKSYLMRVGRDAVDKERKINDKVWHTLMRNCHGFDMDSDDKKDDTRSALEKALDKIPDAVK